tara:strand:+ start:19422 stop:20177 length:756 start_codon:yes stop_codon:yes gene_type:complete
MLDKRFIPVLSFHNEELIKTLQFNERQYIGDPLNAIKIFNEKFVDEIIILDIGPDNRDEFQPDYKYLKDLINECFIPVTYGGGIKHFDDAKKVFDLGVDKICINSEVLNNYALIDDLAKYFGSQSISVSVDIIKNKSETYKIYNYKTQKEENIDLKGYIRSLENYGAGEIVINSVNNDGLMKGLDLNLINELKNLVKLPMIFYGGVGVIEHINDALNIGVDAIACTSFFCFHGKYKSVLISYPFKEFENIR